MTASTNIMDESDILFRLSDYLTSLETKPVAIATTSIVDNMIRCLGRDAYMRDAMADFLTEEVVRAFVMTRECLHHAPNHEPWVQVSFSKSRVDRSGEIKLDLTFDSNPIVIEFYDLRNTFSESSEVWLKPKPFMPIEKNMAVSSDFFLVPHNHWLVWDHQHECFRGQVPRDLAGACGVERLDAYTIFLQLCGTALHYLPGDVCLERVIRCIIPLTVRRNVDACSILALASSAKSKHRDVKALVLRSQTSRKVQTTSEDGTFAKINTTSRRLYCSRVPRYGITDNILPRLRAHELVLPSGDQENALPYNPCESLKPKLKQALEETISPVKDLINLPLPSTVERNLPTRALAGRQTERQDRGVCAKPDMTRMTPKQLPRLITEFPPQIGSANPVNISLLTEQKPVELFHLNSCEPASSTAGDVQQSEATSPRTRVDSVCTSQDESSPESQDPTHDHGGAAKMKAGGTGDVTFCIRNASPNEPSRTIDDGMEDETDVDMWQREIKRNFKQFVGDRGLKSARSKEDHVQAESSNDSEAILYVPEDSESLVFETLS